MVVVLTSLAALLVSAGGTYVVRRIALANGVMDFPNSRSSHVQPTPRGGGVAIVLASVLSLLALYVLGHLQRDVGMALSGGLAVAAVGLADDWRPVSPFRRLLVHVAAAAWALFWLGGLPPAQVGNTVWSFGAMGYVLGTLGIVWTLNLFNFMDGIDGIAGSEAIFIAGAGCGLALLLQVSPAIAAPAAVFAAACLGFLLWNWPPARIFMGDVGSGFLGYVVAVLAMAASREHPVAMLVWLILGGAFFVDSTVTFIRRLARGERFYEAHRSHAYQNLAQLWSSHKRVTLVFIVVNFVWLLPWAYLAAIKPSRAGWFVILALAPLSGLALRAGAGRAQDRQG